MDEILINHYNIIDTRVKITIYLRDGRCFTKEHNLFNSIKVISQLDVNTLSDSDTKITSFLIDNEWIEENDF